MKTAERKKLAGIFPFAVENKKIFQRNSTGSRFRAEHGGMESETVWGRRRDELLAKLAARAAGCPGLYPFREAADFLRVAQDQAGQEAEAVCQFLEAMWQRPEEAVQFNAQSLIRRGKGLNQKADDNGVGIKGIQGFRG